MTFTKATAWIPVSDEAGGDAPFIQAHIEYMLRRGDAAPLTMVERVTGVRRWTASNGVTITVNVGWRRDLRRVMLSFAREAWPEEYADENDCS